MSTATWWAGSAVFEQPRGPRGSARRAAGSAGRPAVRGRVVFPGRRGERAEAILDADGVWSCPDLPILDRVLNALYANRGESDWGRAELARAAAWLKGAVEGVQD